MSKQAEIIKLGRRAIYLIQLVRTAEDEHIAAYWQEQLDEVLAKLAAYA